MRQLQLPPFGARLEEILKYHDPMHPQVSDMNELWTLDEFCRRAHITKEGFRTLRQQGRAPRSWKVGRRVYVHPDDGTAWITARLKQH